MALWKFDASLPTSALYCITHVEYDKCKFEGVLGPLCKLLNSSTSREFKTGLLKPARSIPQGLMTWMFPQSYNTDPIPGLWDTNAKLTRRTPLQLILLNLDRPAQSGRSLGKPSNRNPAFGPEVFYISVAETVPIVEPDGVGNDIGWESVPFVGIHGPILAIFGC